ncbi:hypothetical protein JXA48_01420 [Candidatus Woesearchaeota archaeon]|nr:hypothetical protein [Candidatus Woesearchaeota archaeon]
MIEHLEDAGEELKRADHLIYVSLKYTRTADVLLNTLSRMIDAYDYLITALLSYARDTKNLKENPQTPIEKGNLVKKMYPQQEVQDNIDLYFLLRKIHRAPYDKEQEYRRHVAIMTQIDGREEIVNIDIITQYYEFQKNFYGFVVNMLRDFAKEKFEEENGWEY